MTPTGSPDETDPRFVYTFWNATGECLYVGCTVNFAQRMGKHQGQQPWWPEVVAIDVARYPDLDAGLAAEKARIKELDPIHNRVHTSHRPPRQPLSPEMQARSVANRLRTMALRREASA